MKSLMIVFTSLLLLGACHVDGNSTGESIFKQKGHCGGHTHGHKQGGDYGHSHKNGHSHAERKKACKCGKHKHH